MRTVTALGLLIIAILPACAAAQSADPPPRTTIQFAAGSNLYEGGSDISAALGFSPLSRLTLFAAVERNHVPSRIKQYENGYSVSRGGTLRSISGEAQLALLGERAAVPYVLAGMGFGTSRPNVNQYFPDPVTNDARVLFAGAGIRVAVRRQVSLVVDGRFHLVSENGELNALVPLRGGVAFRF
jgi:hypothetical protein